MSKTRDTGFLPNVITVDQRGNVSIVSGSTTLLSVSSSGAVTTTGVISGSNAANALLLNGTGSVGFATTGSFSTASGSVSSRITQIEQVYATTGSNSFRATQSITGSLTVTGQIIAQTINVQQVTSSIVFSSGSNTFGGDLNNRQTFTGSVLMTGSLIVNTTGPELQVNNNGVILGNLLTDNHSITGSLRITGSLSGIGATFSGDLTIGAAGQVYLTSGDLRYNSNAGFGIVTQNGGRLVSIQNNAFGVNGTATFLCSVTGASFSTTGNLDYNSGAGVNWYINPPANGPTIRLKYHGGSTDRNGALGWVDNSGNRYDALFWQDTSVGIGTSSPDAIFHVAKANSAGLGGQIVIDNPAGSTVGNTVEISFLTDAGASGAGTRNARIRAINENTGNGAANMQFWTWNGSSEAEKMRIASGGNISLGTSDAPTRLSMGGYVGSRLPYIDGTSKTFNSIGITVGSYNTGNAIGGGLDLTNNSICVGAYSPIISFSSLSSNGAYNNSYAAIWGIYQGAGGDANWNKGDLVFGTALSYGISERMRISSSGGVSISGALHIVNTGTAFIVGEAGGSAKQLLVGIDSGTGTSELQSVWQGTAYTRLNLNPIAGAVFAGATRLDTLSDSRVKDDIQPITGALSKVLSITGKKFHLKDEEEGKLRYGFIAQELEGKLDEFVLQTNMTFKKDDLEVENVKSIDNWASSWSALLVEAIKEQQCTINTLKTCIGIS